MCDTHCRGRFKPVSWGIATWLIFLALRSLASEPLDEAALAHALRELIDQHPVTQRTTVTAKVVDLESGQVLFDRGGDRLLTPASNLKIYTTAAALDLLGPDHRGLVTRIAVSDRAVYLIGGGAAMIRAGELAEWADRVAAVIRRSDEMGRARPRRIVNVIPDRWVGLPDKGPGWMWDDEPDYYNMTLSPLMVDFNTLEVVVTAGADESAGIEVELRPASNYPAVSNRAVVSANRTDDTAVTVDRVPFEDDLLVTGSLSPGASPVRARVTMHDPDRWVAEVFAQLLRDRGLPAGETVVRSGGEEAVLASPGLAVLEFPSAPLREVLAHFNRVSENAVGEMLLLHLGGALGDGERYGAGHGWPKGAAVIRGWLTQTAGLDPGSFRLVDGSGLSRYNLISADSSVRLLQHMHGHEDAEAFAEMLPAYAVTIERERTDDTGERERAFRVRAKPGGMSGVYTISGYLDTLDGRRLAFSFLTNGYLGGSAPSRDLRDRFWSTLMHYRPAGTR